MLLGLKQLSDSARTGEKSLGFACELDLSAVRLWSGRPFVSPVKVDGAVTALHGVFLVRYSAEFETEVPCARCLSPVRRKTKERFEHTILEDAQEDDLNDEFIYAPDGVLNVDELVTEDLVLAFRGVEQCREDCRGLCPKCGKNLNEGDCGCDLREPDPRFQKLRDLMEQE